MTSEVIRNSGMLEKVIIRCDAPDCDNDSTQHDIIAGGGLLKMGWTTKFDEDQHHYLHFCPVHSKPKE